MRNLENQITILAERKETAKVIDIIGDLLFASSADFSLISKIQIALEEVLVNVASYAYDGGEGNIVIEYEITPSPEKELKVIIVDEGKEFDPLQKQDPNIVALYEEKKIGGLGIFMTKQLMDEVRYERKDNKNILYLTKKI